MPLHAQSTQSNCLLVLPGATRRSSADAGGAAFGKLVAAAGRTATPAPVPSLHGGGKPNQAGPLLTGGLPMEPPLPGAPPSLAIAQAFPTSPATLVPGKLASIPADPKPADAAPAIPPALPRPAPVPAAQARAGTGKTAPPNRDRPHGGTTTVPEPQGSAKLITPASAAPVSSPPSGSTAAAPVTAPSPAIPFIPAGTAAPKLPAASAGNAARVHAPQAVPSKTAAADAPKVLAGAPEASLAAAPAPAAHQVIPASRPANDALPPATEIGARTAPVASIAAAPATLTQFAAPDTRRPLPLDPSEPTLGTQSSSAGAALPAAAETALRPPPRQPSTTNAPKEAAHADTPPPLPGSRFPAAAITRAQPGPVTTAAGSVSIGLQTSQLGPPGQKYLPLIAPDGGTPVLSDPRSADATGLSTRLPTDSNLTRNEDVTHARVGAGPAPDPAIVPATRNGAGAILPETVSTQTAPGTPVQEAIMPAAHRSTFAVAQRTPTPGTLQPSTAATDTAANNIATPRLLDAAPAIALKSLPPATAAALPTAGSAAPSGPPAQAPQEETAAPQASTQPAHANVGPHAGKAPSLPDLPQSTDARPVDGDAPSGAPAIAAPNAPAGASTFPTPAAAPANAPGDANQAPPSPAGMQLVHTLQNAGAVHVAAATAGNITIHLQPGSLGNVQVRIERAADGAATVTLQVERSETLHALQIDAAHLHEALDRAGLPTAGRQMSFELAQPTSGTGMPTTGSGSGFGPGQNGFQNSSQGGFQGGGGHGSGAGHGGSGQPGHASTASPAIMTSDPGRIAATGTSGRAPATGINITA